MTNHRKNKMHMKEAADSDQMVGSCTSLCQTCNSPIESVSSRLECEACHCFVHITCLQNKALPTNLLGDTFFVLICRNCSTIPRSEVVKRDKVNYFLATPIPIRFGNELPTSVTFAFQFGI